MPQATLRAFTCGEHRPAATGTDVATAPAAATQSYSANLGVGGVKAAATVGGNVGQGGVVSSSGVNNINEDLLAREAELRDDFLRQVRWWRARYGRGARGWGPGSCVLGGVRSVLMPYPCIFVGVRNLRVHFFFLVTLGGCQALSYFFQKQHVAFGIGSPPGAVIQEVCVSVLPSSSSRKTPVIINPTNFLCHWYYRLGRCCVFAGSFPDRRGRRWLQRATQGYRTARDLRGTPLGVRDLRRVQGDRRRSRADGGWQGGQGLACV